MSPRHPFALRRLAGFLLVLLFAVGLSAAEPVRKNFDVPAGDAAATLRQFAEQSGEQVVFLVNKVRGVATKPVRGEFTAREALERMIAGTDLALVQDEQTGALTVNRSAPDEKNDASRPADSGTAQVKDGAVVLDRYEVTGIRETGIVNQGVVPRRENEGVRYTVIDRAEIDRSGVTNLPEFFRSLPSNTSFGTGSQNLAAVQLGQTGGFPFSSDGINLRGFGESQTLIMINGRRLFGGEFGGADVSRIPLSAVDRIEILATSGSAIYGANAVGGVINIILRKGFSGSEASLYLGAARGGAEEVRGSIFHGRQFNDGRTALNLSFEYNRKNDLHLSDRRYWEVALERVPPGAPTYLRDILRNAQSPLPLVTVSSPALPPLGIPGAPTAAWAYVPTGSNGVGLTPASFAANAGQPIRDLPSIGRAKLVAPSESYAAFASLEHTFKNGLSSYSELSWRWADTSVGAYRTLTVINLGANSPVNPFRNNVTPGFVGKSISVLVDPIDLPDSYSDSDKLTLRAVTGLKGKFELFARPLNWAVDFSGDRNDAHSEASTYHLLLAPAVAAGYYNPFRDLRGAPLVSESELAKLRGLDTRNEVTEIAATNWRVNGELMEIAGAPTNFSLGFEVRFEHLTSDTQLRYGDYALLPGSAFADEDIDGNSSRRAIAAYGEVQVPLVGERNRRPGLWSLDFSAAIRLERYDDFGAAAPPMVAFKYAPLPDVALRASFSEGFQPPRQSDLYAPVQDIGPLTFGIATDPLRGDEPVEPEVYIVGGNPNLRPETSKTWDLGVVFTPRQIPGLTLNVAYYRYDKKDVITYPNEQDLVTYVPDRIVRGPRLPGDPVGMPGPIIEMDARPVNLSRLITSGWDVKADYRRELSSTRSFGGSVEGTYVLDFKQRSVDEQPFEDRAGDVDLLGDGPVKLRGRGRVWFNTGRFTASWTARYIHSYEGDTNTVKPSRPTRTGVDGDKIPSSTEHDVQFSYSFPARVGERTSWRDWLAGTKFTLGALNVFDRTPPLRTARINLWHSLLNDPRQRFVYFEATKSF